jgi:isopenicillin-N N-acyltransferase-like protein
MQKINVLEIGGAPYEMGFQHGETYADAIRMFTEERVRLSSDPYWTGFNLPREKIIALGEACLEEHRVYAPELVEELRGMADATGLGLAELVIMNGFTDFIDVVYGAGKRLQAAETTETAAAIDDCTAFIVPDSAAAGGHGFLGQTWDVRASATPYVILLRGYSDDAPSFLSFTTVGCVGMIGMNEAGITVGINNLSGADGRVGVSWNFVVREALRQTRFEEALACITGAELAGAHNYLLMDAEGRGANVEATATRQHVTDLDGRPLVHTNHCIHEETRAFQRARDPIAQQSSERRLERARHLLDRTDLDVDALMAVTRDPEAICYRGRPPAHIATCGAVIADPAGRRMWALRGLPSENRYTEITVA